jgi:lia operon protein LiaF
MDFQLNRVMLAFIIIAVGALLLADNFNIITFDLGKWIATYWPLILLYFGLKPIIGGLLSFVRGHSIDWGGLFWGSVLLFLGWTLLAPRFDLPTIPWDQVWKMWPLFLIWYGIYLILPFRRSNEKRRKDSDWGDEWEKDWRDEWADGEPWKKEKELNSSDGSTTRKQPRVRKGSTYVLLGEIDQPGETFTLENSEYQVGIGSIDLNLTQIVLPDREVTLRTTGFLGTVNLYLPADIPVRITGTVQVGSLDILGTQETGFFKRMTAQSEGYEEATKRLMIRASQVIGEVRIIQV